MYNSGPTVAQITGLAMLRPWVKSPWFHGLVPMGIMSKSTFDSHFWLAYPVQISVKGHNIDVRPRSFLLNILCGSKHICKLYL